MGLTRTLAPTIEPLTVQEAKLHLRVIDTSEDSLISLLIGAARHYAETYCLKSFITQKWALTLDSFPAAMALSVAPYGKAYSLPPNAVLFERGPVQSVDSIVYYDMSGAQQTVVSPAAPDYAIDLSGPIGRMTPGFGKIWPITQPRIGAVTINFTAGYGPDSASVPEGIRQWMLIRIATMYENRESVVVGQRGKVDPLPYVDSLLDEYITVMA